MNSLKKFLEDKRSETSANLTILVKEIYAAAKEHDFKKLLFLMTEFREAAVPKALAPKIAIFFLESNLFFMGKDISTEKLTFGADPEFILCDSNDKVIMYSSKFAKPSSSAGEYSMSSLAIGADYGLLELRPSYSTNPKELVKGIKQLILDFDEASKEYELDIKIKETEAIPFMHKIQRMREVMDEGEELDYGSNRSKMGGVTATSVSDIALAGAEYYGVSLTAYDTPSFAVGTDKVLTAGGHLHFGGAAIKVLSMQQLKALVRKLDEKLIPIAEKIETPAAELRRKYYGFPGEFRLKKYGFEYRVLSCAPFWKNNTKVLKKILKEASRIIQTFDF